MNEPGKVGTILNDRYRLDRELGRGGMGEVYQGYDLLLNRVVAVKILHCQSGAKSRNNLLKRSPRGCPTHHPNIVRCKTGRIRGSPFVVWNTGRRHAACTAGGRLKTPWSIRMQICAALEEAHTTALSTAT